MMTGRRYRTESATPATGAAMVPAGTSFNPRPPLPWVACRWVGIAAPYGSYGWFQPQVWAISCVLIAA